MRFLIAFLIVAAWVAWLLASANYIDSPACGFALGMTLVLIGIFGSVFVVALACGVVSRDIS